MNEKEFNKERDRLLQKMEDCSKNKDLMGGLLAYEEFVCLMSTKSQNGYWNPKYGNRIICSAEDAEYLKKLWNQK